MASFIAWLMLGIIITGAIMILLWVVDRVSRWGDHDQEDV